MALDPPKVTQPDLSRFCRTG